MRSIDRGFYTQYMFKKPSGWPYIGSETFRHSEKRRGTIGPVQIAPPRWLDLVSLLEQKSLLNVWIYRRHVEAILRQYSITSKSAFEIAWRERQSLAQVGVVKSKSGLARFVGEYARAPLSASEGVVELSSYADKNTAAQFFANLQFSLGAYGATIREYPIRGLNHRYATVSVSDFDSFVSYLSKDNAERAYSATYTPPKPGKPGLALKVAFEATLHHDSFPGRILPYDGVDRLLSEQIPKEARASSLSVRDAKLDALQTKLNELIKALRPGQ